MEAYLVFLVNYFFQSVPIFQNLNSFSNLKKLLHQKVLHLTRTEFYTIFEKRLLLIKCFSYLGKS